MTRLCFPFVNASGDLAIEGAIVSRCGLMWFLPYQGPSPEELGGDQWHCNPIRPGGEVVWHLLLFESFCHAVCDDLWEYEKCHSECQQVSKPTNLFLMTRRLTIYTESELVVQVVKLLFPTLMFPQVYVGRHAQQLTRTKLFTFMSLPSSSVCRYFMARIVMRRVPR